MLEDNEDLNTEKLEEAVAKEIEADESTQKSDSTTDETKDKETSEEKDTRTETSLKTESKSKEVDKEKTEEDNEETRFDKHPRWQKLKQERDEALEKSRGFEELRTKLEDFDTNELTRLKEAGKLLRKYPELAEKVQKVIDEHPYGNEEVKREVNEVKTELQRIQQDIILEKYDNAVDREMSKYKFDKDDTELVKEILDNRVINKKLTLEQIPKELEIISKQLDMRNRKILASHIETKSNETKIPKSPDQRGKVIIAKSESSETEDVISELASGLKATRSITTE